MLEREIIDKILHNMGNQCIRETSTPRARRVFVKVHKDCFRDLISFLKHEGFTHLSAITGLEITDGVELLYHFDREGVELTVRFELAPNEPAVPSITDIIKGAAFYEREVHDLFGISFTGHPNLAPLILPDQWPEGVHPMRKQEAVEDK